MNKPRVAVVQIVNRAFSRSYFPYTAASLLAFLRPRVGETFELLPPLFRREEPAAITSRLVGIEVVGFCHYVWNAQINLEVARLLKEASPGSMIVFGGPHVPDHDPAWMAHHPWIDIAVHGPGEEIFTQLLQHFPSRSLEGIGGITWRSPTGLQTSPRPPRPGRLDDFPSPYLDGTLDTLMATYPEEEWLALWETNRGCPFACTFCDWGSAINSKVLPFPTERLEEEIRWFSSRKISFVFCCDANFGILGRDLDLAQRLVESRDLTGWPLEIYVQNTKNATERAWQVQALLARSGMNKEIVLSLQSVDATTLKAIRRDNISMKHFEELQRRFLLEGLETYTDMIVGLPGETWESFSDGVATLLKKGQHNRIKFYNLFVLPNAELARPTYRLTHGIETCEVPLLNIHGSIEQISGIQEHVEMVIATAALPRDDWRRAKVFAWLVGLLHFNHILKIPMIILSDLGALSFKLMITTCMAATSRTPVLHHCVERLMAHAHLMQEGAPEYVTHPSWVGHYFSPEDALYLELQSQGQLAPLLSELEQVLWNLLVEYAPGAAPLAHAAFAMNRLVLHLPEPMPVEESDGGIDDTRLEGLIQRLAAEHGAT